MKETADYLGNTPAVCRASYIHPRVIDLFHGGVTINEDLQAIGEARIMVSWHSKERWRLPWSRCCETRRLPAPPPVASG